MHSIRETATETTRLDSQSTRSAEKCGCSTNPAFCSILQNPESDHPTLNKSRQKKEKNQLAFSEPLSSVCHLLVAEAFGLSPDDAIILKLHLLACQELAQEGPKLEPGSF